MVESLRDVLSESVACSSWRYSPSASIIWVGPQKITHGSFMWNFLYTIESSNVVEGIDTGGETSVETEDLIIDEGGQGEVVEQIGEVFPDIGIAIFAKTLIVETVDLGDLTGFMVASENGDSPRISDLECHKKRYSLNRVVTSINIVSCEQQLECAHDGGECRGPKGRTYP